MANIRDQLASSPNRKENPHHLLARYKAIALAFSRQGRVAIGGIRYLRDREEFVHATAVSRADQVIITGIHQLSKPARPDFSRPEIFGAVARLEESGVGSQTPAEDFERRLLEEVESSACCCGLGVIFLQVVVVVEEL